LKALFSAKTLIQAPSTLLQPPFRTIAAHLAFSAIVTIGLLLRLHELTAKGLSDEAASWTFAKLAWEPFWQVMWNYEGNMVAYYLLLRGWIQLGDSEFILRSLSVIFGVAASCALYLLGRSLYGKLTGLIAAALLAVHSLHIEYSQDARSYSLLVFLIILSWYFFLQAVEQPKKKRLWAAYIVVSSLAFYSHVFAALMFIPQWLSLGRIRLRRVGWTTGLAVAGVLLIAFLPGAIFIATHREGQLQWLEPLSWDLVQWVIKTFTGNGGVYLSVLYGLTCIAAIDRIDLRVRSTVAWLVIPIVVLLGLSLFTPVLTARFILMCLPALALLSARGVVRLSRMSLFWRLGSALAIALLLFLSIRGDVRYFNDARASGTSFGPMTSYILDRADPSDGVIFFTAATHLSFRYYAEHPGHANLKVPEILFPSFGDTPSGAQPSPTAAEIKAIVQDRVRVWLVLNHDSISLVKDRQSTAQMIRATLDKGFRVLEEKVFSDSPKISAVLYVRRPA